jgi:hypothetical protein
MPPKKTTTPGAAL